MYRDRDAAPSPATAAAAASHPALSFISSLWIPSRVSRGETLWDESPTPIGAAGKEAPKVCSGVTNVVIFLILLCPLLALDVISIFLLQYVVILILLEFRAPLYYKPCDEIVVHAYMVLKEWRKENKWVRMLEDIFCF